MLLALAVAAVVPFSDSIDWDGLASADTVVVGAVFSTFDFISAGGGPEISYTAGRQVDVALDCTWLLVTETVRERVCWPSNGLGSFDPGRSGWTIFDGAGEPVYEALAAEVEPLVLTWAGVAVLPIESGTVELQPGGGRHLILVETVARSTAVEHTLAATVAGVPVEVRLTPLEWTWHFGQEIADFTTRTPGGEYPDLSVSGVYTRVEQDLSVTSTITWSGEFRIGDSPGSRSWGAGQRRWSPRRSKRTSTGPASSPALITTARARRARTTSEGHADHPRARSRISFHVPSRLRTV